MGPASLWPREYIETLSTPSRAQKVSTAQQSASVRSKPSSSAHSGETSSLSSVPSSLQAKILASPSAARLRAWFSGSALKAETAPFMLPAWAV